MTDEGQTIGNFINGGNRRDERVASAEAGVGGGARLIETNNRSVFLEADPKIAERTESRRSRQAGIARKSATRGASTETRASCITRHYKYTGEIQEPLTAVAGGEISDAHDSLRSALLVYEIEIICGYSRLRGIQDTRGGIKCHGAAGDGSAINLERASLQVDRIGSGRIQVRIHTANA